MLPCPTRPPLGLVDYCPVLGNSSRNAGRRARLLSSLVATEPAVAWPLGSPASGRCSGTDQCLQGSAATRVQGYLVVLRLKLGRRLALAVQRLQMSWS